MQHTQTHIHLTSVALQKSRLTSNLVNFQYSSYEPEYRRRHRSDRRGDSYNNSNNHNSYNNTRGDRGERGGGRGGRRTVGAGGAGGGAGAGAASSAPTSASGSAGAAGSPSRGGGKPGVLVVQEAADAAGKRFDLVTRVSDPATLAPDQLKQRNSVAVERLRAALSGPGQFERFRNLSQALQAGRVTPAEYYQAFERLLPPQRMDVREVVLASTGRPFHHASRRCFVSVSLCVCWSRSCIHWLCRCYQTRRSLPACESSM